MATRFRLQASDSPDNATTVWAVIVGAQTVGCVWERGGRFITDGYVGYDTRNAAAQQVVLDVIRFRAERADEYTDRA